MLSLSFTQTPLLERKEYKDLVEKTLVLSSAQTTSSRSSSTKDVGRDFPSSSHEALSLIVNLRLKSIDQPPSFQCSEALARGKLGILCKWGN